MTVRPIALLAEDEPILRMVAADMLEDEGFEVFATASAREALDTLMRHPTAALLMTDVQMPGEMDGFALAREVARRMPGVAIIVCSGRLRPEPGEMPPGAHFTDKPFNVDVIQLALQKLQLA